MWWAPMTRLVFGGLSEAFQGLMVETPSTWFGLKYTPSTVSGR